MYGKEYTGTGVCINGINLMLISGVSSTNAFDAFGGSSAPRVEMTGKAAFGVEDDGFGGDDFSRYGFT